jgi:indole-3-glycerol phosphate synthase
MSILNRIIDVKKEEVKRLRREFTPSFFRESEMFAAANAGFAKSICRDDRLGIISEIKKASPSKGIIKADFNHLAIAKEYMKNSTDAISVLTDENFFMGQISFLKEIAKEKSLPLLRKDFIIDEYQIFEAKANGADAALLIAEALSKNQVAELTSAALECNLEVLLEIHSARQLDKIDFDKNKLIGINNRDLDSFNVDLNTTVELAEIIPNDVLLVSESGLTSKDNLEIIKRTNVKAVLVGEHFMKSADISKSINEFKEWCKYES